MICCSLFLLVELIRENQFNGQVPNWCLLIHFVLKQLKDGFYRVVDQSQRPLDYFQTLNRTKSLTLSLKWFNDGEQVNSSLFSRRAAASGLYSPWLNYFYKPKADFIRWWINYACVKNLYWWKWIATKYNCNSQGVKAAGTSSAVQLHYGCRPGSVSSHLKSSYLAAHLWLEVTNLTIELKHQNKHAWCTQSLSNDGMTHLSWRRGMIHMDFPSPGPGSSSRTPSKHQLRFHWSSPSSLTHLLGNEHPGSSFQSEYLFTHTHTQSRYGCVSGLCCENTPTMCRESLLSLTYTAHPSGVEFKVWWAVTVVASRDVDTHSIDADSRVCTFIDIWEMKQKSTKCLQQLNNIVSRVFHVLSLGHYFPRQEEEQWPFLCIFQTASVHWGIKRASLGRAAALVCVDWSYLCSCLHSCPVHNQSCIHIWKVLACSDIVHWHRCQKRYIRLCL